MQVRDEVGADLLVALGLFGVVADHEPLGAGAVVAVAVPAGGDRDLLDPQVVGDGAVAAGAGQRGGGLGVGVAQLLGVDVVPAAAGQVGPVGGGGEPAVGHPHQPAQPPPAQVVLDGADDRGVGGVAGEAPAPHRHPVAGDRHRDHHLRQIGAVVLGVPERPRPRLGRAVELVVGDRVGEFEVVVGGLGLPVGGGGVHEDDVKIKIEEVGDRGEHLRGDLVQGVEQEVHRRVRGVVGEPRAAARSRPARPPSRSRPASSPARTPAARPARTPPARPLAVQAPPGGDPADRRADPEAFPDPVQRPRRAQPAGVQHLDPAADPRPRRSSRTACSGVRNREIDDTNRASAARSTVSARPKLWITFATGFPLTGCRSLCANCR